MLSCLNKCILIRLKNCQSVTTWSPLATVFNEKSRYKQPKLSSSKETGLFGIPELKTPEGFYDLTERALSRSGELIEEAVSDGRKRKMVEIFDELSDTLCKVADLAEFIRLVHPNKSFSKAAETAHAQISMVVEKLNTHVNLYNTLSRVLKNGDVQPTTDHDNYVGKLFLFDFEQSGIHLPEKQRQRVVDLNNTILQVGQQFVSNANTPRTVNLDILPEELKSVLSKYGDNIIINGSHQEVSNAYFREAAYRTFLCPEIEQEKLLRELLNSRHALAQICGFPSYAHRAVNGSTVEKPEVVREFLNLLSVDLKNRAKKDFDEMQKMKDAEGSVSKPLMPWDTTYFISKAKKNWLNISDSEFAPYFSLGACMDGLNILTKALYGVSLESQPIESGEVWADNVYKLAVIDESEGLLGHIYCDLYAREDKPKMDCHLTIRGGRSLPDGSYQSPIVVIHLSLTSPKWGNFSLLAPHSVEVLFHEMGHALHSMLGRTKYQHVFGTRCVTDFAEVPSILMEYFASDPRVVSLFAKHYQTQEPLPPYMLNKLCAFRNIFAASEMQTQVFYSMLDQVYHSGELRCSSTEIISDLQPKYYGLPYVENTAWQLRFSHLVSYGAKYYSYLISRAVASWIWQTYFEQDPLNRDSGQKYRRECLSHGGGKPPSKLVSDFLAKQASAENFARSLITEIDTKTEQLNRMKITIP